MKASLAGGVNFQGLILSRIARPVGETGNSLFFSEGMELFGAMDFLQIILQVFVGLGILNVWLIRANWSTGYRG